MKPNLVIGYGNALRCEEGLGCRVADEVAAKGWAGVDVIVSRQLTPELAQAVSAASRVVFVDAALPAAGAALPVHPRPHLRRLAPADPTEGGRPGPFNAVVHPRVLLGIAGLVYGRVPAAWWLTLPAADFGPGEGLSDEAVRQVCLALGRIASLFGCDVGPDRLAGGCHRSCRGRLSCPIDR
jgi:hypothetical protein